MKINRDNYEAYFLDYHEGQLSPEMVEEVLIFVDQNPDLRNVFEEFEAVTLVADQDIVFEKKSSLKKNQIFATSQVNELNYEDYLVGEAEGLLNPEQLASIEEFISINPQFEKDRRLYALTHLSADDEIVFEAKETLKHKAIPVGLFTEDTFETYLARELEGDLDPDEKIQLAEFMQYNPQLENDRKLYKHTILAAETNIVFENKASLKKSVTPLRRIVYYALSAAASLALMFSVYFLLDRNDIPRNIAEQGKVKNTINSIVTEPATVIPNKQIASNIEDPAQAASIPGTGKSKSGIKKHTTIDNTDVTGENQEYASIVDRNSIGSVQARSAAEISSRSYVDPQFTFIRSSQMYINENREFYYNIKLAEEIQYAEQNSKDKEPAKTILNAVTAKAKGLFASNQNAAPPKEEKKNLSLWTFAELGVQTINTITSSEMELKLQKDEEGKVVAYDFESGLFDFEKELKK
jgi:hypothetical protein